MYDSFLFHRKKLGQLFGNAVGQVPWYLERILRILYNLCN